MASLKNQDGVIFLLIIILGNTASHKAILPISNGHFLQKIILHRVQSIHESEFRFDTKLKQVVHQSNFTTNYFLSKDNSPGNSEHFQTGLLVISRKSIDTGQNVIILDNHEEAFHLMESNVFVVLKKVMDSDSEYFASLVYLRTEPEGNIHWEWDTWIPSQSFSRINVIDLKGQGLSETDLLNNILDWTRRTFSTRFCNRKQGAGQNRIRRKRGLFDVQDIFQNMMSTAKQSKKEFQEGSALETKKDDDQKEKVDKPTTPKSIESELVETTKAPSPSKRNWSDIPPAPFVEAIKADKFKATSNNETSQTQNDRPVSSESPLVIPTKLFLIDDSADAKKAQKDAKDEPIITDSTPPIVPTVPLTSVPLPLLPSLPPPPTPVASTPPKKPAAPVVRKRIAPKKNSPKSKKVAVRTRPKTKKTKAKPRPKAKPKPKPKPKVRTIEPIPRKLDSNHIYLVKPAWYPSAVDPSPPPPKQQGRSFGQQQDKKPLMGSKVLKAFPATKALTLKKATAVSTSQTNVGKATAKATNNVGGVALANAETKVKGDAYASSRSIGRTQGEGGNDKVAISNANTVQGGLAVAKAEVDGYKPDVVTKVEDREAGPTAMEMIKQTDDEFNNVLAMKALHKAKRSVGIGNMKMKKCQNLDKFLNDLDSKFFAKFNKFKYPQKKSNHNLFWFFEKNILSLQPQNSYSLKTTNKICSTKPNKSESSQELFEMLKLFNLECDESTIAHMEKLTRTKSITIKDKVLEIDSSFPSLTRQELSIEEIRNLTALVIISAYTSALQKLEKNANNLMSDEFDLLTLTIIEAIYITNQEKMSQHKIKLTQRIVSLVESTLGESLLDFYSCKMQSPNIAQNYYKSLELELQVRLALLRFSQSFRGFNFKSVEEVTFLFRKYYSHSYPVTKELSKCLLNLN